MKLVYHLTKEARTRLFVETGRDPGQAQALEVDPTQLSKNDRAFLAECGFAFDAKVNLSYHDEASYYGSAIKQLELPAIATDPAELLAAYRDARTAGAVRLFAADEARIAKEIASFNNWQDSRLPAILNTGLYRDQPRRQEWIAAHATAMARAKENEQREAESKRREAAAAEAAQQARIEERRAWALAHGSPRLRKCVEAGYDCQRLYVFERAALEHPAYVVDFDDKATWKSRSGPSEAALDEAARVGGEIIWLTSLPDEDYVDPCEAVVIREYLGKYDLVKAM